MGWLDWDLVVRAVEERVGEGVEDLQPGLDLQPIHKPIWISAVDIAGNITWAISWACKGLFC